MEEGALRPVVRGTHHSDKHILANTLQRTIGKGSNPTRELFESGGAEVTVTVAVAVAVAEVAVSVSMLVSVLVLVSVAMAAVSVPVSVSVSVSVAPTPCPHIDSGESPYPVGTYLWEPPSMEPTARDTRRQSSSVEELPDTRMRRSKSPGETAHRSCRALSCGSSPETETTHASGIRRAAFAAAQSPASGGGRAT